MSCTIVNYLFKQCKKGSQDTIKSGIVVQNLRLYTFFRKNQLKYVENFTHFK